MLIPMGSMRCCQYKRHILCVLFNYTSGNHLSNIKYILLSDGLDKHVEGNIRGGNCTNRMMNTSI